MISVTRAKNIVSLHRLESSVLGELVISIEIIDTDYSVASTKNKLVINKREVYSAKSYTLYATLLQRIE